MTETAAATPDRSVIRFVAGARTDLEGGAQGRTMYRVLDDGALSKPLYYKLSTFRSCSPGNVYTVEGLVGPDGKLTVWAHTLAWADQWHDGEARLRWELADQEYGAARARAAARRRAETDTVLAGLLERLQPLKEAYDGSDYYRKTAIEHAVLRYLRGVPKR